MTQETVVKTQTRRIGRFTVEAPDAPVAIIDSSDYGICSAVEVGEDALDRLGESLRENADIHARFETASDEKPGVANVVDQRGVHVGWLIDADYLDWDAVMWLYCDGNCGISESELAAGGIRIEETDEDGVVSADAFRESCDQCGHTGVCPSCDGDEAVECASCEGDRLCQNCGYDPSTGEPWADE